MSSLVLWLRIRSQYPLPCSIFQGIDRPTEPARLSTPWPISSRRWLACNIGLRLHRLGSQIRRHHLHHPTTPACGLANSNLSLCVLRRDASADCTALHLPAPAGATPPPTCHRSSRDVWPCLAIHRPWGGVVMVRGSGLACPFDISRPFRASCPLITPFFTLAMRYERGIATELAVSDKFQHMKQMPSGSTVNERAPGLCPASNKATANHQPGPFATAMLELLCRAMPMSIQPRRSS